MTVSDLSGHRRPSVAVSDLDARLREHGWWGVGARRTPPKDPLLPHTLSNHIREWPSLGKSMWTEGPGTPGVPPPQGAGRRCACFPSPGLSQEIRR